MKLFESLLDKISPLSPSYFIAARRRLESQIRPAGSLGYLEELVERLVAIQETSTPAVDKKSVYVFAADHGVAEEGVSLYPREVTAQMVYSFLGGSATINVLARHAGAEVRVIDMGVDHTFSYQRGLVRKKVAYGTANFCHGPAMTSSELELALRAGVEISEEAKADGIQLVGTGDMGIGNTTSSSAVIAALTGKPVSDVTGRGTGIDAEIWERKVRVIETALEKNASYLTDPLRVLQAVGGFEIAGIAGLIVGCAAERIPVVIDGLIASAAALAALELHPSILDYVFFGHRSYERGQDAVLKRYGARPVLDLDLRLGEGTGACLAMGVLEGAVKVFNEVATFAEAQVANKRVAEAALRAGD
ncbi:MAG: nicotinate-nucleotide--dimethylbenzimidazole phosphoribosyltransferase [Candidatus Omnitrophica bacterium]|nr:nicotinate-nucleotide--dimethylbenzimidazole phosphoribosyltransferase [Candidatus Omnitrophota bacterium]